MEHLISVVATHLGLSEPRSSLTPRQSVQVDSDDFGTMLGGALRPGATHEPFRPAAVSQTSREPASTVHQGARKDLLPSETSMASPSRGQKSGGERTGRSTNAPKTVTGSSSDTQEVHSAKSATKRANTDQPDRANGNGQPSGSSESSKGSDFVSGSPAGGAKRSGSPIGKDGEKNVFSQRRQFQSEKSPSQAQKDSSNFQKKPQQNASQQQNSQGQGAQQQGSEARSPSKDAADSTAVVNGGSDKGGVVTPSSGMPNDGSRFSIKKVSQPSGPEQDAPVSANAESARPQGTYRAVAQTADLQNASKRGDGQTDPVQKEIGTQVFSDKGILQVDSGEEPKKGASAPHISESRTALSASATPEKAAGAATRENDKAINPSSIGEMVFKNLPETRGSYADLLRYSTSAGGELLGRVGKPPMMSSTSYGELAPANESRVVQSLEAYARFTAAEGGVHVAHLVVETGESSTRAVVREQAGAVDVRVVTSSTTSADAITSELPTLQKALDATGVRLKSAQVYSEGKDAEAERRSGNWMNERSKGNLRDLSSEEVFLIKESQR